MHEPNDHTATGDWQRGTQLGGKVAEDLTKLTVETFFLILKNRKDKLKVSLDTPKDAVRNVKEAQKMGAPEGFQRELVNAHSYAKQIAKDNPDMLTANQDRIIDRAAKDNLIESQKQSPQLAETFKQTQKQQQEQKQRQVQKPSF